MLISVVMPVKNAAGTVLKAVQSILQQSINKLELIIIDDHSKDDSLAHIEAIGSPRIKYLSNQGKGIAAALTCIIH